MALSSAALHVILQIKKKNQNPFIIGEEIYKKKYVSRLKICFYIEQEQNVK